MGANIPQARRKRTASVCTFHRNAALPLSRLFSLCLQSGCQPSSLKTANVVPVHKRDSKAKAQHYRPVSLLSVMSKVMESIVNSQIMNHLERYGLLSPNQFGFRRRIGAADLLTSLHHEWVNAVGSGGTPQVLAIDIAGAFWDYCLRPEVMASEGAC